MKNSTFVSRLGRAVMAVATSILTGATAGAALAHKPLVVRCDPPRPVRRLR